MEIPINIGTTMQVEAYPISIKPNETNDSLKEFYFNYKYGVIQYTFQNGEVFNISPHIPFCPKMSDAIFIICELRGSSG